MNMRATRRKIIIEMLKNFPKTIGFKCKMAPNDNIPVNIGDVLQKELQWLDEQGFSESQALQELYS